MSGVLNARYPNVDLPTPDAAAGRDTLNTLRTGSMVRPILHQTATFRGGKRRSMKHRRATRKVTRQSRRQKGGFIPSIGEGFSALAAKYITPVALYSLFRFMNGKSRTRRVRRNRRRSASK
jgi:hypothetical protein